MALDDINGGSDGGINPASAGPPVDRQSHCAERVLFVASKEADKDLRKMLEKAAAAAAKAQLNP